MLLRDFRIFRLQNLIDFKRSSSLHFTANKEYNDVGDTGKLVYGMEIRLFDQRLTTFEDGGKQLLAE